MDKNGPEDLFRDVKENMILRDESNTNLEKLKEVIQKEFAVFGVSESRMNVEFNVGVIVVTLNVDTEIVFDKFFDKVIKDVFGTDNYKLQIKLNTSRLIGHDCKTIDINFIISIRDD
jgi:hypothetical protein